MSEVKMGLLQIGGEGCFFNPLDPPSPKQSIFGTLIFHNLHEVFRREALCMGIHVKCLIQAPRAINTLTPMPPVIAFLHNPFNQNFWVEVRKYVGDKWIAMVLEGPFAFHSQKEFHAHLKLQKLDHCCLC